MTITLLLLSMAWSSVFAQSPNQEETGGNPVKLKPLENIEYEAVYDAINDRVTLYRKIGGMNVRLPYSMSLAEYQNDRTRQQLMEYWVEKSRGAQAADNGGKTEEEKQKNTLLNAKWRINSDLFASIFGSNQISMKLQGQAKVQLGVQVNKIDNPTIQERMRKTTAFDFDQSVQINLNSQIGERMKLGINYNTQATFDFENEVKLDYSGTEDDIIQNIELGNISWALPGTLIQGSQSLFGAKMDMKFGKLSVTTVFSQKRGESSSISVQGGATKQEFDIDITNYERNRHFFLSHFFKDMYDDALRNLPTITSGITINKVEVWITNKTGNYNDTRNIIAFTDLGESKTEDLQSKNQWSVNGKPMPSNDANNLYEQAINNILPSRVTENIAGAMASYPLLKGSRDYEKIENARKLSPNEYTLNEQLGYISLSSALNNNEVLAVAFQYTYRGQTYKVGEFSTDGVDAPKCLFLKLLKGTTMTPKYMVWDLMMKNIYSLGAYDIEQKDFQMNIVYCNDSTSNYVNYFSEGAKPMYGGHNGETYLQIMGLDRLNNQNDLGADGRYDFIDGYTINRQKGLLIFPKREPFGKALKDAIGDDKLSKKYVFEALYDSTQVYAKQQSQKNKFRLRGYYTSSNSQDISLNAFNVAPGSVIVTAGGQALQENVDYSVDYAMGKVKILNQSILNSGQKINIQYENEQAITTQTQTLVGAHLNYEFNPNFNMGATVIHMKERPLTNKVAYGDESISNTMLGFNTEYSKDLPFITKALDALPIMSTKEKSSIAIEAEMAKLIAGHTKTINAAYIDDFEGSSISYDIKNWTAWHLASKPQGQSELIANADAVNDLSSGYDRAKLAWYQIDPLFLRKMSTTPKHIQNDPIQQSSHYVREVYEEELYPNKESAYGESTNISVLNLAYYPNERGQYNFSTDIDRDGFLNEPETKWAGIQRKLETTDFEQANIEYIEFWMLDPFIYNHDKPNVGGELYFNIGNISEDVLRDSRKSFEHGLPTDGNYSSMDSTAWGFVPKTNALVNSFNTDPAQMLRQDVGLNGMNSEMERSFYKNFISDIEQMYGSGKLTQEAYETIMNDPANDDYHYYRGSDYDAQQVSILDRYKRFNNTEGNSRPTEYSGESYATAAWSRPDNEDLNEDYTLAETENYYQYRVSMHPDSLVVGKNHITDMMRTTVKLKNGKTESVNWYQFKIPVAAPEKVVGDIEDMSSMQFMRIFMTGFSDTCIMRFATMDLVRGEWRKYTQELNEPNSNPVAQTTFETSTVNIEENDRRTPVNYVLPPGIDRTVDPSNPQLRQLNEQAYSLRVHDLGNGDARAVYKTLNMDWRQYKRLKMFVHAEQLEGYPLENNQMSCFVRIGSDYVDNYYEYEIPLMLTPHGGYTSNNESDRYIVWPEANELDIPLDLFTKCKLARNSEKNEPGSTLTLTDIYSMSDPEKINNRVRIKGNPSLGNVVTIMIGIRAHGAGVKSAEVWVNELRLTEFNESGGWAARGRTTLKLADLGTIQAAGEYSSIGFGSIDQSVLERQMSSYKAFDISANLELGKLMGPRSRMSMPFYAAYSRKVNTPEYSPYDNDVKLQTALDMCKTRAERDSLKNISETTETTKSINFTNVKLKPAKGVKKKIISPTNLSATYSYSEIKKTDPETEYELQKDINTQIAYNFASTSKTFEPFKKSKMNKKYFGLLTDLAFYKQPTLIAYRWEITRNYEEVQKRNVDNPEFIIPITVNKNFGFNRYFDFKYNITRNLRFGLNTATVARVDEPNVPVNKDRFPEEYKAWKDSTWSNFFHFGRTTDYQHSADLNWTIPINKLPYLDFTNAAAQYKGQYWWQAEKQNTGFNWGNVIKNSQNLQINGSANLSMIYNRNKSLKALYDYYDFSSSKGGNKNKQQAQTVRYSQNDLKLEKGMPLTIKHNLKTTDITARVFDQKGKLINGKITAVDANTAVYQSPVACDKARIVVTGTISNNKSALEVLKDVALQVVTGIKNIQVSYSQNGTTTLPGYLPNARFAGFGSYNGFRGPGFGFIAGWQDRDFAAKAVERGWITTDTTINQPYLMTSATTLQIRGQFELFKALKVELSGQRQTSKNLSEYYVFNASGFDGVYNTMETGNTSLTICSFGTAFKTPDKKGDLKSTLYDDFLRMRYTIAERHSRQSLELGNGSQNTVRNDTITTNNSGVDGFGLTAQQVMMPAFIAAYTGMSADKVWLGVIPSAKFIRPNWRVTFSGLSNIAALKNIMRNLEISHSYTSKYQVGGYETNLDWVDNCNGMCNLRDLQGNFISKYTVGSISISEQLNPLIQVSATFINNLTASVGINKQRTISLSLANNQINESYSNDWNLSLGYRFDNLKLFFGKENGGKETSNDLNLNFTLSQRDNYTILRRIEENTNELASGSKTTSLKISADYAFNRKLSMEFYYDQQLARPYVSSSYPTNNVNVGISFTLSLSE